MVNYEVLDIVRDAMNLPGEITCEVETSDLEFLNIGGADIGMQTECAERGFVISLMRTRIYKRSAGTRIEVRRARQGEVIAARVVIDPSDLDFIDECVDAIEKTTARVAEMLVLRFTAKNCAAEGS